MPKYEICLELPSDGSMTDTDTEGEIQKPPAKSKWEIGKLLSLRM